MMERQGELFKQLLYENNDSDNCNKDNNKPPHHQKIHKLLRERRFLFLPLFNTFRFHVGHGKTLPSYLLLTVYLY